jgi:hypothetical protein
MQHTLDMDSVFCHKVLEQYRSFLVYVTRTYPSMVPYLKGLHLTLDSWRMGRDAKGWKSRQEVATHLGMNTILSSGRDVPPQHVTGVPRLRDDLQALAQLTQDATPPQHTIRSRSIVVALYGFGDASGAGFGSMFLDPHGVRYRYGVWGSDLPGSSSNFRELFNLTEAASDFISSINFANLTDLVNTLEVEMSSHMLAGAELYLFTDNSVAEAAFFKGTSSNRALFDLIIRLMHLEIQHSLSLHVIHVAGHRMQAQGTDGLSRGDTLSGIMRGQSHLMFAPLHLSACDRSQGVVSWCTSRLQANQRLHPLLP